MKIYGLIFEKKEKFDSESLNPKFIIFQKSAMKFFDSIVLGFMVN